jgi:hypothetical protein
MLKQILRLRIGLVFLLGILLFCSSAFAMADRSMLNGGERHYYRDGRWYKHDSRGHEITVAALAIGALIESLPPQHTTVVIQGTSYYHDDRYYYRQAPRGGYTVVAPPERVQPRPRNNRDERGGRGDNGHNEENRGGNH